MWCQLTDQNHPWSSKFWHILTDNFVTNESGTGIVHCAPAFGEEDYRVCLQEGVIQKGEGKALLFDLP